jgi:hypothetical protein
MIKTKSLLAELEFEKEKASLSEELKKYKIEEEKRKTEIAINKAQEISAVEKEEGELTHRLIFEQEKNKGILSEKAEENRSVLSEKVQVRLGKEMTAEIKRNEDEQKSEMVLSAEKRKKIVEFRSILTELEQSIIRAQSSAHVDIFKAVQPDLIKAIEGLGDKTVLAELASNLPQAGGALGFLTGVGGLKALKSLVEGTKLEEVINALSTTSRELAVKSIKDDKFKDKEE